MIPIGLINFFDSSVTIGYNTSETPRVNYQVTHCLNLKFFNVSAEGGAGVKSA